MRGNVMLINGIILIIMSFVTKNINNFLEIDTTQSDVIIQPMVESMVSIFPLISNLMVFMGIVMIILGVYYLFINDDYSYESSYASNNYESTNNSNSNINNNSKTIIKEKSKKNNFFYDDEDNGFFQILHNLMTSNNTKSI